MVDQLFYTRCYSRHRLVQLMVQLATIAASCLIVLSGSIGANVWAQAPAAKSTPAKATPQTKTSAAKESGTNTPAKVDQSKLVRSIYELTKTTKSAKQLTEFIAKCDSALVHDLTSKNTDYVTSLKGWALNLRGQKRTAVALQLKQVGNTQYETVLKQAMDDFDQAIVCDPDRYRSWMARGIAFAQTGEYAKAALNFTSVIKLKTDLADGWFNRAESLYHLGRFEAAVSDYETVLRLQSDDAQSLTGLGHSKLALGKTAEALAHYQAVAKLQPESPNAFVNIGDAFEAMGNWGSAQANFAKSISIKTTGVAIQRSAWLKATCPDASFRNPAQAIELAKRAISLTGESVVNLDTLAAAQAAAGKFNVAKTTQQQTIVLASAVEEVEDGSVENPYKARLALYEEEKPFMQSKEPAER